MTLGGWLAPRPRVPLPRPELPLGRGGVDRYLPWVVAPMAFLAALALAALLVLSGLVARWDEGGGDRLTLRIPSGGSPINDALTLESVLTAMSGAPGIAAVQPVPVGEIEQAISPWLGNELTQRLALPMLVEVVLDGNARIDVPALRSRLLAVAPGARIEARPAGLSDLADLASVTRWAALAGLLTVLLATALTVVFVARAGLAIHANAIQLLHVMGATDLYVAQQFQRHVLVLALRGAVLGVAAAMVALLLFGLAAGGGPGALLPRGVLGPLGWLLLLVIPPLLAGIALVSARLTVLGALERLP